MASKSKSKPATSTPLQRPSSPLSPTRHSRMQEKADLQNLNDRLASYIDRVRYLENENNRLTREVQHSQEVITKQVTDVRQIYDNELTEARKLLDESYKEKARLEIDTKRLWDENEELRADLAKKKKELIIADNSNRVWEQRFNELQIKHSQTSSDAKKALGDLKEAEKERDKLRKLYDENRKLLEDECLARVDVENHNQSLREELSFKDQVYQKEITETRSRRQIDVSEIDGRLAEKYEAKLQEALAELRDQYETQMSTNRREIEVLYDNEMKNLQNEAKRYQSTAAGAVDELRTIRTRIDTLTSKISELEGENQTLLHRCRDLEAMLSNERARHADDLAALDKDLARLRAEMCNQLQEYQDLMDIKVSLDVEIAAYRKLLESEEARLNLTPSEISGRSASTTGRRTPSRLGMKRKRTLLEESRESSLSDFSVSSSSKGDIEIVEVDAEGRFVKLRNKNTQQEIALSGWSVVRKVGDDGEDFVYRFHRTIKLEAGGVITIWSSNVNEAVHEPPHSVVMKGQRWFVGDNMVTKVVNGNGEEVAVSERSRQQLSQSMLRHREGGYLGSEELHHQFGDPQGDEKCLIM